MEDGLDVESMAVVVDGHLQVVVALVDDDADGSRAGMAPDVRQRFLQDSIEGRLDRSLESFPLDLDELLEERRRAGLAVDLRIEGEPRELAEGIDRSVYRIVQEGLTNALKYAGPAHATVRIRYGEQAVELEVLDDGQGPDSGGGRGFGLLGMRERAALYGGTLDAQPRPGGGYALRASLPLESVPS